MGLRKTAEDRKHASNGDLRSSHVRIAAQYREAILNGDIEPGETLPSTVDMMEKYGVSTTAIQNAFRVLKEEGLVTAQRGKLTIANDPRMQTMRPADFFAPADPGKPYRWIAEAERRGRRGRIELLHVGEVEAPLSVAKAFGLAAKAAVMLRRQMLLLDDEPAELAENYYPVEIARGTAIAEQTKVKGGVPTLLAEMGFPFRRAVDRVSARMPTIEQGEALAMPAGEIPVLRTFRKVYSDNDRVIEVSVLSKAGHLYELEYEVAESQLPG